jgi:hypothetical protein
LPVLRAGRLRKIFDLAAARSCLYMCVKRNRSSGAWLVLLPLMVGLVTPVTAQRAASHDWRIVSGVRVGPITAASTEPDLRRAFGDSAVVNEEVDIGEGMTEPGTMIYKRDLSRALSILWDGEGTNKHPTTVFICHGLAEGSCRWQTGDGIRAETRGHAVAAVSESR